MKKTTIWLSEADIELRDELAAQLGRSASEIVRLGLHDLATFHLRRLPKPRRRIAKLKPPQSPQEKSTGQSAAY